MGMEVICKQAHLACKHLHRRRIVALVPVKRHCEPQGRHKQPLYLQAVACLIQATELCAVAVMLQIQQPGST